MKIRQKMQIGQKHKKLVFQNADPYVLSKMTPHTTNA